MKHGAEGFLRHRGLILAAAGGAVAEGGLLTLVAPNARYLAPQVTAVPSLAAYHDLRWLFADTQSWVWFAGLVTLMLIARAAIDVALLRLAWPRDEPAPRLGRALASCAALTVLAWVLLSPAVTLTFGAAVLPFSWPFLAAFPIMLGIVAVLSHGGAVTSWWRRLPPLRSVGWLLGSFLAATLAAVAMTHLSAGAAIGVIGVSGLVNARAWYSLAAVAARGQPRTHGSLPARLVFGVPYAPVAALLVFAMVLGVARLMFTGTIQLPTGPAPAVAVGAALHLPSADGAGAGLGTKAAPDTATASAVLIVGGWGSSCCGAGDGLRGSLPGVTVRQFSYIGLNSKGKPIASGSSADDLPLPALGDRMAAQVLALHAATGRPVAVVAESEGSLGAYAMLSRHPGLPISDVVLLSPIVSPGQADSSQASRSDAISQQALGELDHLVGSMSPYGSDGAQDLIDSVSEYGARYFSDLVDSARSADGKAIRWLTVIPLADAVTLPSCSLPSGVIVVPAFHGGLLGDPTVLPMVSEFLAGHQVPGLSDGDLREEANLISGASAAWRMPDTGNPCPSDNG